MCATASRPTTRTQDDWRSPSMNWNPGQKLRGGSRWLPRCLLRSRFHTLGNKGDRGHPRPVIVVPLVFVLSFLIPLSSFGRHNLRVLRNPNLLSPWLVSPWRHQAPRIIYLSDNSNLSQTVANKPHSHLVLDGSSFQDQVQRESLQMQGTTLGDCGCMLHIDRNMLLKPCLAPKIRASVCRQHPEPAA